MFSITSAKTRLIFSASTLSVLLATGCLGTEGASDSVSGAQPAGAAERAEPASYPQDQELTGLSNSFRWFRWSKGDPVKTLMPTSTHVCGLTMVRGELATSTSLMVVRQGANWVLRGLNPGSNFLQADAVCEPLSAFRVNAGRTVTIAGDFLASTTGKNVTRSTPLPARTAPIFTGLVGRFEGGG
ncbi:MAG TPA: hypothetical protein VG937_09885, partial [Polyangiaceae bacterium]|nr:hypothetical protein [Polyangiaceae bacterium]